MGEKQHADGKVPKGMEITANTADPFLCRTLSLPHHLLEFFEACATAPERKTLLASLLRRDPPLLANFLDALPHTTATRPRHANGDDWLTGLLQEMSENALQQFALCAVSPWLTLDIDGEQWLLLRELHFRAHTVAEIARQMAGHCETVDVDEAFLAGGLHNLGKLMLFSLSPTRFLSARSPVLLGAESLEAEQKLWGIDHISLAAQRIRRWPLDSDLGDAVTFLYEDAEQYRCATPLVQLLYGAERLSREREPEREHMRQVGKLLGIGEHELQSSLFHGHDAARQQKWTQLDDSTFCARQHEAVVELRRAVGGLAHRVIDENDLCQAGDECELVAAAVQQLRRFFRDALVFTLSGDRRHLIGCPAPGQPGRIAEMRAPFEPGDNLAAHALLENEIVDSIHAEDFALSLLDRQLGSLVGGEGFCCVPLRHRQVPVGVVVLPLSDAGQRAMARDPRVRGTVQTLARRLGEARFPGSGGRSEDAAALVREMYHELGNPLSAVRNHLYVLKRHLDEEGRATLARVEEDITRVTDLLNQYRQRAQNRRQTAESTDINQLARETIARVAGQVRQSRALEAELEDSLPAVNTNRLALQQILVNLLNNALEATEADQRVTVSTSGNWRLGNRDFVELCVRDEGPGLPESVRANLFRPVASTKGGEHAGLGLNIVKSLADEIGAAVHCHSDETGTRFRILIPYQPPSDNNNEKKPHEDFTRQSLPQL